MRVLVVGGAGKLGHLLVPHLQRAHDVTVADLNPSAAPEAARAVGVDVTRFTEIEKAVRGHDAVIYLAMGRYADWGATNGWAESHFDVNVKGLYLTLRAAGEAGLTKAVYAGSLSVFTGFLEFGYDLDEREPNAVDAYGLSKALGERVCDAASWEHGMGVVALRLCMPMSDDEWRAYDGEHREIMTAASDVAAAFAAALDRETRAYERYTISGDWEGRYLDPRPALNGLGWIAQMRRESVEGGNR
ncbi:NAD(P)-dependent oxidoreductase [Kribbella sp. NPDC050459]|uniref:NAD-dependent epimerase/dehydratase family protein n=1 Tax=Kribbella sp. NPDC050459 TaxID=3155785 RepID=UPI0034043420